jgi:hypothetical protein
MASGMQARVRDMMITRMALDGGTCVSDRNVAIAAGMLRATRLVCGYLVAATAEQAMDQHMQCDDECH